MIDPPVALRNTLHLLQQQPQRYKLFGVWWWPVKALLKRQGYTITDLYILGDYVDPITAAMVPATDMPGPKADFATIVEVGPGSR
jgi:hypothetical protein